jgi:hypothetical protein
MGNNDREGPRNKMVGPRNESEHAMTDQQQANTQQSTPPPGGQQQQANTQQATPPPGEPQQPPPRNTGPLDQDRLDVLKDRWTTFWGGNKSKKRTRSSDEGNREGTIPAREKSAIEKMRDKLADFDEDYKDIGERMLGVFTQMVGYLGPFALVLWIGSDLGGFFSTYMGTIPSYGLAYTIECIIAACTVSMGRAFAEIASGRTSYGKTAMVLGVWLILNASSAFGLYLVITGGHPENFQGIDQLSMVVRVCAVALADLGCSAVLMFKGRSIQKYIESTRKRATAIGELADAQRSIEEADKNAALREQMMKSTLKIQEDLSNKIGEAVSMVMTSILEKMEKALKEDTTKTEKGYGRR